MFIFAYLFIHSFCFGSFFPPSCNFVLFRRRISSRVRYGATGRPVYGRIVHQPTQQVALGGRYYEMPPQARPSYDDFMNMKPFAGPENMLLGSLQNSQSPQQKARNSKIKFRNGMAGGGSNPGISGQPNLGQHAIFGSTGSGGSGLNQIAPQRGSFQRLKELVWTERARELSQQRKSEELAARAAVLKDITNGQQ
jgi:hypothetical protein